MQLNAVHELVYPSRIEAIKTLLHINENSDAKALAENVEQLRLAANQLGRSPAAELWHLFADAVECIRLLEEWHSATFSASLDADRWIRAAKARMLLIKERAGNTAFEKDVITTLKIIEKEITLGDIATIRKDLACIPMPISIYADPEPALPDWAKEYKRDETSAPEDLAIAFLEFAINGNPAQQVHWLASRQTHDLEIAIRVSRWPENAEKIQLSPISLEPKSTFDLPTFEFNRPKGEPPYVFQQRGRMILHSPQDLHARPYEFIYAAEFTPLKSEQPIVVAGQRTLRLDSNDLSQNPITGYPGVDRKIIQLRDYLRLKSNIPESELNNALILLASIGNLMGQAVQDARYPNPIYENAFQEDVRQFLRQIPRIGVELEEQAQVVGGRTDLSFRGIRIELKSERQRHLTLPDCSQYAEQAATYAVGTNNRIAFLCILDSSLKNEPPFPIEDGLSINTVNTATSPIYVITCLIQGGIPKPSYLSR